VLEEDSSHRREAQQPTSRCSERRSGSPACRSSPSSVVARRPGCSSEMSPRARSAPGGDALWWALTTLTTVGYGDHVPVTTAWRLVAAAVMLTGVAVLGGVAAGVALVVARGVAVAEEQALEWEAESLERRVESRLAGLDARLARIEAHLQALDRVGADARSGRSPGDSPPTAGPAGADAQRAPGMQSGNGGEQPGTAPATALAPVRPAWDQSPAHDRHETAAARESSRDWGVVVASGIERVFVPPQLAGALSPAERRRWLPIRLPGPFADLEVIRVEAGMPTTRFCSLIGVPERTWCPPGPRPLGHAGQGSVAAARP
jgi:hypothetical protein